MRYCPSHIFTWIFFQKLVDIISGQKSMNLCPAGQYLTGHNFALQIILRVKSICSNLFLYILPFIYQWLKFVTPKRIVHARFLVHYLHSDCGTNIGDNGPGTCSLIRIKGVTDNHTRWLCCTNSILCIY
jgi:hypothetical protein